MNEKFHERFEIVINSGEAKLRFIARVQNKIFSLGCAKNGVVTKAIANALGERFYVQSIDNYVGNDFYRCLQAIEAIYETAPSNYLPQNSIAQDIEKVILEIIDASENDLGIQWKNGRFSPAGARLLDRVLVNDELRWLSSPKFKRVLDPFQKGLRHFLEAEKRPELLFDVITDMYESVEALAKIFTGREEKDLSANAELFLSKIDTSPKYKAMLKNYIEYANDFRHAVKSGQTRSPLKRAEVESFIYLTGLFIRLAQQSDS